MRPLPGPACPAGSPGAGAGTAGSGHSSSNKGSLLPRITPAPRVAPRTSNLPPDSGGRGKGACKRHRSRHHGQDNNRSSRGDSSKRHHGHGHNQDDGNWNNDNSQNNNNGSHDDRSSNHSGHHDRDANKGSSSNGNETGSVLAIKQTRPQC